MKTIPLCSFCGEVAEAQDKLGRCKKCIQEGSLPKNDKQKKLLLEKTDDI